MFKVWYDDQYFLVGLDANTGDWVAKTIGKMEAATIAKQATYSNLSTEQQNAITNCIREELIAEASRAAHNG